MELLLPHVGEVVEVSSLPEVQQTAVLGQGDRDFDKEEQVVKVALLFLRVDLGEVPLQML